MYVHRTQAPDDDGQLPATTVSNLARMVSNLNGPARVRFSTLSDYLFFHWHKQKDYEEDFLNSKPNQQEYIQRLQQWRDKYGRHLESRPRIQSLDNLSHYLTEFQYGKFDEIEIPGQYTEVCGNLITSEAI